MKEITPDAFFARCGTWCNVVRLHCRDCGKWRSFCVTHGGPTRANRCTCVEVPPEWEVTTYSPAPAEEKDGSDAPNPLVGEKATDSAGASEGLVDVVAWIIGRPNTHRLVASQVLRAIAKARPSVSVNESPEYLTAEQASGFAQGWDAAMRYLNREASK